MNQQINNAMGIIDKLKGKLKKDRKPAESVKPSPDQEQIVEDKAIEDQRSATKKRTEGFFRMHAKDLHEKEAREAEILEKFLVDYRAMQSTFRHYEIPTDGMPKWEKIKKSLINEIDRASKLNKPTLVLIPPTSWKSKVRDINEHPINYRKYEISAAFSFDGIRDVDKKHAADEHKWRVLIVEGIEDVPEDRNIYNGERNNREMCELWIKKYENQGLDVINDLNTYLILTMKSFIEDNPIDSSTKTILNPKERGYYAGLMFGTARTQSGQAFIDVLNSGFWHLKYDDLRLRGLIEVKF